MPFGRLTGPRLAAAALAVLALHLLLLRGMRGALPELDRAEPSRPLPAVRVLALAPGQTLLDASATVAPPPAVPAPRPAGIAAELAQRSPPHGESRPRPALSAPPLTLPSASPLPSPPASELASEWASPPETFAARPAVAVADGAVAAAAAGDLPIYRTLLPPAFALGYDLRRGTQSGQAELHWLPQGEHYRARLAGTGSAQPLLAWESIGGFDGAGLAPARYTDSRRGRGTQAANFRRDAAKVTFSGPSIERALPPGAQDRLSWMLQLAAIAAAEPSLVGPGGRVSFLVVGVRGDADVWTFGHMGHESLDLPGAGAVATVRLLREPPGPYDTRAEVWLDPARSYLPVRARLSHGAGDEGLQLLLREVLPSP